MHDMESQCGCVQTEARSQIQEKPKCLHSIHEHQDKGASHLFLLLLGCTLDLRRTTESLLSVLTLLAYILSQYHQVNNPILYPWTYAWHIERK
jgi:hypothetical protein